MTYIEHSSHSLEDVSYHGSAIYRCEYCDKGLYDKEIVDECPKAADAKAWRLKDVECREKNEYQRMLAEKQRFEYLKEKYG